MSFFTDLFNFISKQLNWHTSKPTVNQHPYSWDSENPELELSELIYVLHILTQRLRINSIQGGSFAKLRKELFGLFGLNEAGYSKKVDQINNRKKNEHFLQYLAQKISDHNAKLHKVDD